MKKESGIILALSSLDGKYSIGSLGKSAIKFIDFISDNGFSWWQMLPICKTDAYNSPYNSASIFSIDPFYIDLEILSEKELLTEQELKNQSTINIGKCNYEKLKSDRLLILRSAFNRFKQYYEMEKFIAEHRYIKEYCVYTALCNINNTYDWREWKIKEAATSELYFQYFLQFEAYSQFKSIGNYARLKNVKLMGDLPLYTSLFGSEVYFHRDNYLIDEHGNPLYLSGARPDGFSSKGQCWGHPVYDWKKIKDDGFDYWKNKIIHLAQLYDGIRFDHFRGYESYWAIPASTKNATEGFFLSGPGKSLFDSVEESISGKILVGEDLGITTAKVQALIDELNFYNMRVFQYGLDKDNEIDLPVNYTENCIAYTGTHDNHTLKTYLKELSSTDKTRLRKILHIKRRESLFDCVVRNMYSSKAALIFFSVQDILRLDDKFILNTHKPNEGNWSFRLTKKQLDSHSVKKFKKYNGAIKDV